MCGHWSLKRNLIKNIKSNQLPSFSDRAFGFVCVCYIRFTVYALSYHTANSLPKSRINKQQWIIKQQVTSFQNLQKYNFSNT